MNTIRHLDHRMRFIPIGHQNETGGHFDREPSDAWVNDFSALAEWRRRVRARRVRVATMMLIVLLSGLLGHWLTGQGRGINGKGMKTISADPYSAAVYSPALNSK